MSFLKEFLTSPNSPLSGIYYGLRDTFKGVVSENNNYTSHAFNSLAVPGYKSTFKAAQPVARTLGFGGQG